MLFDNFAGYVCRFKALYSYALIVVSYLELDAGLFV